MFERYCSWFTHKHFNDNDYDDDYDEDYDNNYYADDFILLIHILNK